MDSSQRPYPRAMLVDLDGTLLVWDARRCWQSICNRFLSPIRVATIQEMFEAIQEQSVWFWSDPDRNRRGRMKEIDPNVEILTSVLCRFGIHDSVLVRAMAHAYVTEQEATTALSSGAIESLLHFRGSGVRLAMVTNGDAPTQRHKIEHFDLAPLFDAIVVEGELGVGKPDPRVFMHALAQLDTAPSETWMVGDNLEADIRGAQRLGIYSIWVRSSVIAQPTQTGRVLRSVSPDLVVNSFAELRMP